MKLLIFDSGPLINFSLNGMLSLIDALKETFEGKFIMTEQVRREVYERPRQISKFEWGALKIAHLLTKKVLEMPEAIGMNVQELNRRTNELMQCANTAFKANGRAITIVSDAEISCIALAQQVKERGHDPLLVIDERTARLLCEAPEQVEHLMASKLHTRVATDNKCLQKFKGLSCIRSPELAYVAYKKNLLEIKDPHALEALIYATKFKGAAISWEEINILKRL